MSGKEVPENSTRFVGKVEPMKKQKAPKKTAVKPAASSSTTKTPLLSTQPRSTKDAAAQAGMFLSTDDTWSAAYFDDDDLHSIERELFG